MTNRTIFLCALLCSTTAQAAPRAIITMSQQIPTQTAATAPFPQPKHLGDPATLGQNIQRAMTLLAMSTAQKRNTVRILFYGQSITEQNWAKLVAEDLKRRFPHANLVIENRALGGFSSQLLVKTAESDLYAFAPDLVIFHVYGAHDDYERIIRGIRERTTAEVLIQTDHATKDTDQAEETDPAKIRVEGAMWNSFMNYVQLPTVARKYHTGVVDQRNLWKRYLRDTNTSAKSLLSDDVHLNDWGSFLMAEFARAQLVRREEVQIDAMNCETVRTFAVGGNARRDPRRDVRQPVRVVGNMITLPFEGNRVDVIFKPDARADARAAVRIDGKKPGELGELYSWTRALSTPGGKWPVILKIGSQKAPVVEEWTMQAKKDPANDKRWTFSLRGSKTGADGAGASDQMFVSKSGRVVIDPKDWNVDYSLGLPGIKPVPDALTVKWSAAPHFVDELAVPAQPDASMENVVTLAHGLAKGKHTLELSGAASASIAAIRVYKPPFQAEPGQP